MKQFNPHAIRELRRLEGLSQNKLATILGITPESVRNYEHNRSQPNGFVIDFIWRQYIIGKGYELELYQSVAA